MASSYWCAITIMLSQWQILGHFVQHCTLSDHQWDARLSLKVTSRPTSTGYAASPKKLLFSLIRPNCCQVSTCVWSGHHVLILDSLQICIGNHTHTQLEDWLKGILFGLYICLCLQTETMGTIMFSFPTDDAKCLCCECENSVNVADVTVMRVERMART